MIYATAIVLSILHVAAGQTSNLAPTLAPSSITDLADPLGCPFYSWNQGWIVVSTNAFAATTSCCSGRVNGWKLYGDVLNDLKGNPNAPPYCYFTKRLGSELVLKTLVADRCSFLSRINCGDNQKFRCNMRTSKCAARGTLL